MSPAFWDLGWLGHVKHRAYVDNEKSLNIQNLIVTIAQDIESALVRRLLV